MPMYDLSCANGHVKLDALLKVGELPACETCGQPTQHTWTGKANGVIPDDIPGGIWIKHGICNDDGSPRKYYSKSEMAAEAKRRGLRNNVEHVTAPGTDKNRYTTRWV